MSQSASPSLKGFEFALHAGGLGVVLVVVYATWSLAIEPLQRQHQVLVQRTESERKLQAQRDQILARHAQVQLQVADYEASFAHALTRLPETPRESEFLAQITHLARTCRLKIQRYHPREPVNEGTHTALEVQLDANADYEGICQFLDGLRGLARLCRVTRLRIHTVEPDGTILPVEMMLRIYYAPLIKADALEARHG